MKLRAITLIALLLQALPVTAATVDTGALTTSYFFTGEEGDPPLTAVDVSTSATVNLGDLTGLTPGDDIAITFATTDDLYAQNGFFADDGDLTLLWHARFTLTAGAYSVSSDEIWSFGPVPWMGTGSETVGYEFGPVPQAFSLLVPWGTDLSTVTLTMTDLYSVSGVNAQVTQSSFELASATLSTTSFHITIDPISQRAYLKASNADPGDEFGKCVAISGDTVVIGSTYEASNATGIDGDQSDNSLSNPGAVYVFVRNGMIWTQQAYLKASNTDEYDHFGSSVAIHGDTIVVGAWGEGSSATGIDGNQMDNSAFNSGAAYVFVRNGTTWTQQAYLKASNTEEEDYFGNSVAVNGDTIVVGANGEDSNATGVDGNQNDNSLSNPGAAYVFVRNGTTWTQQAYLKAGNPDGFDDFGRSVAVDGDTVIVGAWGEGSDATGINGDQTDNSAGSSGAAYVFVRDGTTWNQQAYLKAGNAEAGDGFGRSVALSGETAVIGASGEDSSATEVNGNQTDNSAGSSGAAYVFFRNGTSWSQQAYLKAGNAEANDLFGNSVAVNQDVIVVGANGEDSGATGVDGDQTDNSLPDSGAAYVFQRSGTIWTRQAYLKASNTGLSDLFGISVGLSGDTMVVGSAYEDSSATGVNGNQSDSDAPYSGAAYIFGPSGNSEIALSGNGVDITNGDLTPDTADHTDFGIAVIGSGPVIRAFSINNSGDGDLSLTGTLLVELAGSSAFTVSTQPSSSIVAPGGGMETFTIAFDPATSGLHAGTVSIANDDADENPFTFAIQGRALSHDEDTDTDGLNDASEFEMAALGFDWQVAQPELANTYYASANGAGLFTTSQVQALHVGAPLLERDPVSGTFKLTIGVAKSADLTHFAPFPMTVPQTTLNASGKLEFEFESPDDAAFFRVEAE